MKRILVAAIGVAVCFLYVLLDDPFGRPRPTASPPRLEEAPPSPALPEPVPAPPPAERAGSPAAEPSPAPVGPAFLDGRVVDLAGRAVKGARAALFAGDGSPPGEGTLYDLLRRVVPPPVPALEAASGDDGSFRMPAPGPGRYRLVTEARGFARDVLDGIELSAEMPGGSLEIVLAPGTELRGRIVTPEGTAVPGAVVLVRTEATAADPEAEETAVTDSFGRYDFPSLPAGREWSMLVRAEGHAGGALTGVRLPQTHLDLMVRRGQSYRVRVLSAGLLEPLSARVLVRQGEVPLAAGETDEGGEVAFRAHPGRRVTIHVAPEDYAAASFERALPAMGGALDDLLLEVGSELTGVVVEEGTGRGLPGAAVRADRREHAGILPPRWLESGEHGLFVYRGYDGRGLLLAAFAAGYVAGGVTDEVVVEGWPAAEVPIPLAHAGSIRGHVHGPGGRAVEDATVRVVLASGAAEGEARTRRDGGFELVGAPVRRPLRVVAWHPQYGYAVTETLRLDPAAPLAPVHLQLTGANPLRGHVVDELGGGVVGVRVLVTTVESEPLLVADAVTGAAGRFAVDGLASGRIRVVARGAGYLEAETELVSAGGAFPQAELRLRRLVPIDGTVFHADRRPAAAVQVRAWPQGGDRPVGWGFTDVDGRFTVAGIGAGHYRLVAEARDGSTATAAIAPGQTHITLVLAPRPAGGKR
jgi:hypothetical protein